MARQIDFSNFYLLLEAFDRLGFHLYADEWTGREAWARPAESPDKLKTDKSALRARLESLDESILSKEREFRYATEPTDQNQISSDLDRLRKEHSSKLEDLRSLPVISDVISGPHASFERRATAEKVLWDAARSGDIVFRYGPDTLIDWTAWMADSAIKVHLSLSMARVSSLYSNLRRGPVFVDKVTFDRWLRTVRRVKEIAGAEPDQESEFRAFLKREIQTGTKSMGKGEFQDVAENEYRVGKRPFQRIWDEEVPASWKRGGRPATRNKPTRP